DVNLVPPARARGKPVHRVLREQRQGPGPLRRRVEPPRVRVRAPLPAARGRAPAHRQGRRLEPDHRGDAARADAWRNVRGGAARHQPDGGHPGHAAQLPLELLLRDRVRAGPAPPGQLPQALGSGARALVGRGAVGRQCSRGRCVPAVRAGSRRRQPVQGRADRADQDRGAAAAGAAQAVGTRA
ncbi:hypothetical protein EG878_17390, partial [Enterococcus faecalis]